MQARAIVAVTLLVLLTRAPFLPPSLGDIDSTNFALALEEYDPLRHRPHPPGYPIFIALVRAIRSLEPRPERALALTSALAQALVVAPLFALLFRLSGTRGVAWAATILCLTTPALWFNGARPMSDSTGLLFAISGQALLLAAHPAARTAGAFVAGLSCGVRLQTAFLTFPVLAAQLLRQRGRRLQLALSFALGTASWVLPVAVASGGLAAYTRALGSTVAEAAVWESLFVGFTPNRAIHAIKNAALGPWVDPRLGALVVILSGIGVAHTLRTRPTRLALGLLLFGPYLAVHVGLQWTDSIRYALPYLPLVAWLTTEGLAGLATPNFRRATVVGGAAGLAGWSAALVLPALASYALVPSPAVAALWWLERAAHDGGVALGGHFVFYRHLDAAGSALPLMRGAPGKGLTAALEYWRKGGESSVLFLAEPGRTDFDTLEPAARRRLADWEWPARIPPFLPGARPNRARVVRLEPPLWFAGTGWMLSTETGRLSDLPRQPEREAYLKACREPTQLLVAGEPVAPSSSYVMELRLDGALLDRVGCGDPMLRGFSLPPSELHGYRRLTARTSLNEAPAGAPFVLKGLAYGPARLPLVVHGPGWFFSEPDERLRVFRWTSARARSLAWIPEGGARLIVEGLAPLEYLPAHTSMTISVEGGRQLRRRLDRREFRIEVSIPGAGRPLREIRLETSATFVPDTIQRNGDRRRLGVRVYAYRLETIGPAQVPRQRRCGGRADRAVVEDAMPAPRTQQDVGQ